MTPTSRLHLDEAAEAHRLAESPADAGAIVLLP